MPKTKTIKPTAEEKILSTLFQLSEVYKTNEPKKECVQTMAGVKQVTFSSTISRMKDKHLIEYKLHQKTMKLTKRGKDMAAKLTTPNDLVTSNEQHHENIKNKLSDGLAQGIFEYLSDGQEHNKKDIMEAIECTNQKTFGPLLSKQFKKPNYIEYPSKDTVRLTDQCFPFGRP